MRPNLDRDVRDNRMMRKRVHAWRTSGGGEGGGRERQGLEGNVNIDDNVCLETLMTLESGQNLCLPGTSWRTHRCPRHLVWWCGDGWRAGVNGVEASA